MAASATTLACGLLCVVSIACGADLADPGPFATGERQVTVMRPDTTTFTAQLFYPATVEGDDTPLDSSGGPYPAITFGHGFVQQVLQYEPTLRHLASHGYVVMATNSQLTLAPDHAEYAKELSYTLDFLTGENTDGGSELFGQIDIARYGASGHSMGSGASILAAASDPQIRAVANLAASETDPSAIAAMADVDVPISLITGTADTIVPTVTNGQLMFDAGTAPKQLPQILGGSHCGFQDLSVPLFCDTATIPLADQLALTRRELTAFFDLYLKEDQSVWRDVWGPERLTAAGLTTNIDPGVTLAPDAAAVLTTLDSTAIFEIEITNTGPEANSFTLLVEDDDWDVDLSVMQTSLLAPGESQFVLVEVTPSGGGGILTDEFLLSARSDADGLTRGFTALSVAVPEPSTAVLLAVGTIIAMLGLRRQRRSPG